MNWNKINLFRRIYYTGWIKTIFINFKMLPFGQAIKFPILLSRYTHLYSLSGKIVLDVPKVKFRMFAVGFFGSDTLPIKGYRSLLKIEGCWIVKGNVSLGVGASVRVEKMAKFITGDNVKISNMTKIVCYENIVIGNNCRIAWDSQIIDTNFHYMKNIDTGEISELSKPIVIGNNCWVGNRTTIMKGCELPDFTIVASSSFLNKKYEVSNYSLLAGSPAKLVKTGIYRCLDDEESVIKKMKNQQ